MTPRVLDAWALLALLQGEEPAASRVRDLLVAAEAGTAELFMSIINLGEVIYRIGKRHGAQAAWETRDEIRHLALELVPASDEAVYAAVEFKIDFAISYADAFAAATADGLGGVLVTGDPELIGLDGRIEVEALGR